MKSDFRISAFPSKGFLRFVLSVLGPLIDRILGFKKMKRFYEKNELEGLPKEVFVRKALESMNVNYKVKTPIPAIPSNGRFIIVCNHPFGGIEGIILADLLMKIRPDVKFMANSGLSLIRELDDFFIFTNPLVTHNYKNVSSIRACQDHLEKDGLLVFFPAGRVSFYHKDKKRITDGEWNRIAAKMSLKTQAPVLPVFFAGTNSPLFQRMGRIYYRFRLLMLPREFMKMQDRKVELYSGRILEPKQLQGDSRAITDFLRMQTYLQDPAYIFNRESEADLSELPDVIPAVNADLIKNELMALPEKQHLLDFKNYSVYYGYHDQLENTVREITRLREVTFREMQEGSGAERDTDRFDETYTQLLIFDNDRNEIIGAYRMGQIDRLLEQGDAKEIYLSKMFNFKGEFFSKIKTGVEMGRSFLIKREQRSMYGFYLLWRGIGEFFVRNPRYRYAYGTVSLSNIYDPRSIALIHRVLVGRENKVEPVSDINIMLHPEVEEYIDKYKPGMKELNRIISMIEVDGKGLPVLVRQYGKLGADFVSIGSDIEFRRTPGMLLIINLGEAQPETIKRYFAEGTEGYLKYPKA